MLQIKNLTIKLREDDRTILEDFSFSLNPKDKVGLIGEEGNGKSILLKTLVDRKSVEEFCQVRGEISKGNEIIGYLPQSLEEKFLPLSPEEYLEKILDGAYIDYNLLYKYLGEFNLGAHLLEKGIKMKDLSGGEKIKFALVCQMLKDPTLFLFDEPSNDLDYQSLLWLENFMKKLDLPLIFVSHDPSLLSNVANRIIHLEQTHRRTQAKYTISNTGYEAYVENRDKNLRTQTTRANKDQEEFSKKVEKFRRVHDSVESALRGTKNDVEGRLLAKKMHTVKSISRRLEKEEENLTQAPDYEEAIDVYFDKTKEIPRGKIVLDYCLDKLKAGDKVLAENIHLQIIGPEKICIIGKNGAGKTTLLRKIYEDLKTKDLKVGYMPQTYFEFENENISALDYLAKSHTKEEHTEISTFLGNLNFKREEMYRKIKDLSGGQKAKLFFAKMNLQGAQVLILDEPTRNLSPLSQPEIIQALKEYKGGIIGVSHDRDFIDQVFDKVYELNIEGLRKIK